MAIKVIFPFTCNNEYSNHPPYSLVRQLAGTDLDAKLWVMRRGPNAPGRFVRTPAPGKLVSLVNRINRKVLRHRNLSLEILEARYAAALQPGDAAWVYRGCSLDLMRTLRKRGHPVFLERINTMDHTAKRIIDDAFARAGWPVDYQHDPIPVLALEQAQADAADFIFSPSPAVTESLLERNIAAAKILECSYGWEPERFKSTRRALPKIDGTTVLFVGRIGVRKGAHLLLEAWSRAGLKGRLVLLGPMDDTIAERCAMHLRRDDVIHLPYNPDTAPVYRCADIFILPTLEEGSPLVSYEAIGNGLPVITSAMGAGRIIRHRREGLVVDPHDRAQLIDALRTLADSPDMRRTMAEAGRVRATEFTWDKVAARRHELIRMALRR